MTQRWPCSDQLMAVQEVSCLPFPLHLLQEFITLHLEDGKKSRPNICMIMMLHRFFYDNFKAAQCMFFCKAALVLSYVGYFQSLDHTSYSYKCSLNVSAWVGYVLQSFIGNSKARGRTKLVCFVQFQLHPS